MAALRVFLPLAICLLLGHQMFAYNQKPCQKSNGKDGFKSFTDRHILKKMPETLDEKDWKGHIKTDNKCARTKQSFLGLDMLDKVKAVCTKAGGKLHKENLCISKDHFKFVTVTIEAGTCKIKKIIWEEKHLILACDDVEGVCLPVHFEGNYGDKHPEAKAPACI